jgi:hypothetical protein
MGAAHELRSLVALLRVGQQLRDRLALLRSGSEGGNVQLDGRLEL